RARGDGGRAVSERPAAMRCDECRSQLGGYVLGALEPEEMEEVRAHVAVCADCSREHAGLATLPAMLDAAGSVETASATPPAALEAAVLDRFARERPRVERPGWQRLLTRPLPVAAAARLGQYHRLSVERTVGRGSGQRVMAGSIEY